MVAIYYPHIAAAHPEGPGGNSEPALLAFYGELVERVARLAAKAESLIVLHEADRMLPRVGLASA